jgi:hypothetical protein
MHITDRKDNDLLVKHIINTSSVNKSVCDLERIRQLAEVVNTAPKLLLKVRYIKFKLRIILGSKFRKD